MSAPITGPMTRERFICTDVSETAPVRSSRGTRVGRIALRPGAPSALAMPIANTSTAISTCEGCDATRRRASPNDSAPCSTCMLDEQAAPVDAVGEQTADHRQEQQRAELAEVQQPDVEAAVRQLQRVLTEDDVLHPRADVRRERPDVDDAKVAVAQRGGGGTPLVRDIAVDEGVLDVLELGAPRRLHHASHPTDGRRPSTAVSRRASCR